MRQRVAGFLRWLPKEYRFWLIVMGVSASVFLALADYFLWWTSVGSFAALGGRSLLRYQRQGRERPGNEPRR